MEEIKLFAVVLVVHYIDDFILQTDSQAKGKSKGSDVWNLELFKHVLTYTGIWGLVYFLLPIQEPFNQPIGWIFFVILIGVPHYITDWITSRIGKIYWDRGDTHTGFCIIGVDQIIHYACLLFVMYGFLIVK